MKKSFSNKKQTNFTHFIKKNIETIFKQIAEKGEKFIKPEKIWELYYELGILDDDPRLAYSKKIVDGIIEKNEGICQDRLFQIFKQDFLFKQVILRDMIIPEFIEFTEEIENIFNYCKNNILGNVASYIPELAKVDPDQFAISICTVDGQRFSYGDATTNFCIQSTSKPVNYCLALEELGIDLVHEHIGREPSGTSFNDLSLNKKGLPHNPMINAGAIMSSSLIYRDHTPKEKLDKVKQVWHDLSLYPLELDKNVYNSERKTADRNFALAYFMREKGAFMPETDLIKTLELYFQCCSLTSNTDNMAIAAATIANAGINPLTGKKVFQEDTVRSCLSLMLSCGMYDFSGEFAFKIGLPAKSGVSGAMFIVIPNVMGISIWSPRLDELGNSVRGVEFCEQLLKKYNFHHFDSLLQETTKKNPRKRKLETKANQLINTLFAASNGDVNELKRLHIEGMNLNVSDYDGRTALHLAASENQIEVVEYLIEYGVFLAPIDRWGNSPLKDAERENHTEIIQLIINELDRLSH